jgi:acyl-coenzyme A synthetase/AMP-(fatty) acid ligase
MLGYLGDEALTAAKLGRHASTGAQPVVYTGDTGYLDGDGYLYLAGRADAMIKTSGYRVYPAEIEDVLTRYPGVSEAVVFGVEDPRTDQRVVAVVVANDAVECGALRVFCSERLATYMTPRTIEKWPALPRTASGKPALAEVRRRYLESLEIGDDDG